MKTVLTFTLGIIITMIATTYLVPQQAHVDTIVVTRVQQTALDPVAILDRLQDLDSIDPNLADDLYVECIKYLQQQTDDMLVAIAIHVERRWQSDACAAADSLARHGWF